MSNNYVVEETNQNKLMSKKCKTVCMTLKYIELFLILASTTIGCLSTSYFAFLVDIPIGTRSV